MGVCCSRSEAGRDGQRGPGLRPDAERPAGAGRAHGLRGTRAAGPAGQRRPHRAPRWCAQAERLTFVVAIHVLVQCAFSVAVGVPDGPAMARGR